MGILFYLDHIVGFQFVKVLLVLPSPTCFFFGLIGISKYTHMQFNHFVFIVVNSVRIVASLRLKNERGERLSSHRSDHVTGVWGELTNLYNVQRLFHHLGCAFFVSAPNPPFP